MSDATMLHPGLRRVTAPNAGPMTYLGTNSYLIGEREVVVVDPGPDLAEHRAALLRAVGRGAVSQIVVTHAHLDHSEGAAALAAEVQAPVLAFGGATAGRWAMMARLAEQPGLEGGEGLDHRFQPDQALSDGMRLETALGPMEAIHTPGHLSSHLCFALPEIGAVLSGDTVMSWSTTLISPPDGSVSAFLASLDRLMRREERWYLPGHGDPVEDGVALAAQQKQHRLDREAQILTALEDGSATPQGLVAHIYADVPAHLHPAAARNVLAHLIDLAERGRVTLPVGPLATGRYQIA